jgi:DNA-binding CsgD family transcriptional regulator
MIKYTKSKSNVHSSTIQLTPQQLECACLLIKVGLLDDASAHKISNAKTYNPHLSKREIECLQLTVRGQSARMVATYLGISQRTVEEYLTNIKLKFGVSSKSELINIAIDHFRDI